MGNPAGIATLLLLVALAPACATARAPGESDFEALYEARQDSARTRFSEADVRFVTGMIGHHAQALEMASLAPTHGASPAIQTLAGRVINGQRDEIATMERWLTDRGQPVPEPSSPAHAMAGAGHAMHMPGMLTAEQMADLAAARGPEFDRLFLTYMIQHHRGGGNGRGGAVRHGRRPAGRGALQDRLGHPGRSDHRDRPHGIDADRDDG